MDPVLKSIWRHRRRRRPAAELRLEDVLVRLCRGLVVLGRAHTVGPYTPALPDPAGYAWCVMDRGGPVVLAFDAWEAARWFISAERWGLEGYEVPLRLRADAELQAQHSAERLGSWFASCDAWLSYRRQAAARAAR